MSSALAPARNDRPESSRLDAVARLRRSLAHLSWFAATGEELTRADREEGARYLEGLGITGVTVAAVASWQDAKTVADDPAWDRRWWDAEEEMRAALMRDALADLGEPALLDALTGVAEAASDVVQGAAAVAAARSGTADPALIKSAAGAATQAAHLAALAAAAGAGADHVFAVKFRLYEAGRWPLGIVNGRFYLL